MSRLPLRVRLTLAFAVVMALVLAALGGFLYARLADSLDRTLDQGLRARADDVAALAGQPGTGLGGDAGRLVEAEESFAQILAADGRLLDATPQAAGSPLLSGTELDRARGGALLVGRRQPPGFEEPVRLLARPAGDVVVVVGAALDDRDDALASLRTQLATGGPIALFLAALAGYGLSAAALRPVEAMRRRAETISAGETGTRLPVPAANDEIARLGATLNDLLARLEATLAREQRFVADASHELRTPLALLKAELELALRRPRPAAELERTLRSAAEEVDGLARLADDLLVLARSARDEPWLAPARENARELLRRVAARFEQRTAAAGRELRVDCPPGLSVVADRARLEQALANLLENALRHGEGAVELTGSERAGTVELHVTDEGSGFPPPFLARAFERFSRADEARSSGGSGLGLAIADAIARGHGGCAAATNRPGGGADVWLSLPAGGSHRALTSGT
ncbi:MAG: HAMP domain-containing protein [Thermoleophilia bacterium]|nr:HAMP domain-containing protein [Thermoleophilia bacterium]